MISAVILVAEIERSLADFTPGVAFISTIYIFVVGGKDFDFVRSLVPGRISRCDTDSDEFLRFCEFEGDPGEVALASVGVVNAEILSIVEQVVFMNAAGGIVLILGSNFASVCREFNFSKILKFWFVTVELLLGLLNESFQLLL